MGLIIGQGKSGGGGAYSAEFQRMATLNEQGYNLFDEVKKIRKDSRASGYAVIIMGLYYQGYNSLVLKGADAYITCDGDFYEAASVTEEITHHWHDYESGKLDRYVAFLLKEENQEIRFDVASTMPRGLVVDGICGEIKWANPYWSFRYIATTNGSSIYAISQCNPATGVWLSSTGVDRYFYLGRVLKGSLTSTSNAAYYNGCAVVRDAKYACLNIEESIKCSVITDDYKAPTLETLVLPILKRHTGPSYGLLHCSDYTGFKTIRKIYAPECEYITKFITLRSYPAQTTLLSDLRFFIFPKLTKIDSFYVNANCAGCANLIHFEIGQGFYSNLDLRIGLFTNCLLTDSNDLVEDVVAHPTWSNLDQWLHNFEHLIVDKLADLSGQTAKTITLAAAPYAAITESIRAKMSAKNWNLASA